jgi:hypothetical protein
VSDIDIHPERTTLTSTYHPVGWDDWLFMSMASKRFTSKMDTLWVREWMSHSSTMMQHNHNTEVRSKCAYIDRLCCCSGRDIRNSSRRLHWDGGVVRRDDHWILGSTCHRSRGDVVDPAHFRATKHWQGVIAMVHSHRHAWPSCRCEMTNGDEAFANGSSRGNRGPVLTDRHHRDR